MSVLRPLLNGYLRLVEKRKLARTRDVHKIRRDFAKTARLLFRAPRGTQITRSRLVGAGEVLRVTPAQTRSDLVVFYIHGGGFVFGSPDTHGAMLGALAQRLGAVAVLPYYRFPPQSKMSRRPIRRCSTAECRRRISLSGAIALAARWRSICLAGFVQAVAPCRARFLPFHR